MKTKWKMERVYLRSVPLLSKSRDSNLKGISLTPYTQFCRVIERL
jgi:hypothetical protein